MNNHGREGTEHGICNDPGKDVSVPAARAALEQLLADPRFHASPRNRRFLRFVAEESFAGRRERVKAYAIAVDVFGRGPEFDSALDPIVRIEATRLREALSTYFEGPGRNNEFQIRLPRGGYVPQFERASAPLPPDVAGIGKKSTGDEASLAKLDRKLEGGIFRRRTVIAGIIAAAALVGLVVGLMWRQQEAQLTGPPVVILESGPAIVAGDLSDTMASGFAQSLVVALSRFDGLKIVNRPHDLPLAAALAKLEAAGAVHGAVYALDTNVRQVDRTIRFGWNLMNTKTGESIWADIADLSLDAGMKFRVEDQVASKIAMTIGQPQGLLAMRDLAIERTFPTKGYGCVLRARAYYLAISEPLHKEVRGCLEQTVVIAPDYADAWAMLAFVYLDEDRNNFNRRSTAEDARNRALASAQRAAALEPDSESAQEAMMGVLYRVGNFDDAFAAGRRALQINPHNPELMTLVGARLFLRGHYDEGAALVRNAIAQTLVVPPLDRVTLVLDAYRKGDYQTALQQVQLIDLPQFYGAPLLRAAIYGEMGRSAEARENIEALLVLRPSYASEMRPELRSRHYAEPLIDMLADGVQKAGLAID